VSFSPQALLFGGIAAVFVVSIIVSSRRMKQTGLSPRRQQKRQRLTFYYSLGVLVLFMAGDLHSGRWQWPFYLAWGFFIVTTGWLAFRRPSELDLIKTFAIEPGRCSRCGYDLTGNVSGVCSECGWQIPAAPIKVEHLTWAIWWQGWRIEHLENWRKSLVWMIVLCVIFGGMTVWLAGRATPNMAMFLPALMFAHFAINALRVYSYGRRQSAVPSVGE